MYFKIVIIVIISILVFTQPLKLFKQNKVVNESVAASFKKDENNDSKSFFYLPAIETYYSAADKKYIYLENGRWVFSAVLPKKYKGYEIDCNYKVALDEQRPYLNFERHQKMYPKSVSR